MKKSDRIHAFLSQVDSPGPVELDPRYRGYFACFNQGLYYDAHDVLEDLWLRESGRDASFYKGLIQFAGAYVHLQKQYTRPEHPKDGRRLAPASRLLALAVANLGPFRPAHLHLDVEGIVTLAEDTAAEIVRSRYTHNPWQPDRGPKLTLH